MQQVIKPQTADCARAAVLVTRLYHGLAVLPARDANWLKHHLQQCHGCLGTVPAEYQHCYLV